MAHGGHCVARHRDTERSAEHEDAGRVVFVRHALPGERITAEVTELHKGYLRADAVQIDTTELDVEDVVSRIEQLVRERQPA